jgi:hypothetical protein
MAIAVPAGWRALDADIQADGPQMRPKQQSFTIGDANITMDMDRGIMPAGGKASVTLVATSDRPHKVTVRLNATEDMGYGSERVPNPPLEVGERSVTLDALPGGGPPVVATFTFAKKTKKPGYSEWFDISATDAHKKLDAEGSAASVGVATWSGNSFGMTIEPPNQLPVEGSFSIAVRIKNTTNKAMKVPYVMIGGRIGGPQGLDTQVIADNDDYKIEEVGDGFDEEEDPREQMIAPGAERLAVYSVTPRFGIAHFTFVAQARSEDGGGAMATATMDRPEPDRDVVAPTVISRR